jgi:hypothetical protein
MNPWLFVLIGYVVTVAVETPILLAGLSPRHSLRRRFAAGLWLSACTYPIVVLVLPPFFSVRSSYLIAAETFAPLAECLLFWFTFAPDETHRELCRDLGVIVLANLASFGTGELLLYFNVWA